MANKPKPSVKRSKTESTIGNPPDPAKLVEEIIEQRKASLRYYNSNFYEEWAEIYRNVHTRTRPHMLRDEENERDYEDTSRTNVCVPDHFVMLRRGTARLTRNPPNLRVRGGPDTPQAQASRDKTAARLMFNWDRSESQRAFKKAVNFAYGIGWSVGKVYYDEVPIVRQLRRLTRSLQPQDFKKLAKAQDPRTQAVIQQFGARLQDKTPFSPDEQAMIIQQMGDETSLNVSAMKYKGPVLAAPFVGDVFPEPGFPTLNESGFIVENSVRDADWLKYWQKVETINPITGETSMVFPDAKICQQVLDSAGSRTFIDEQELSLRRRMREEIELADPITSGKPIRAPRKRVMIDERHTIIDGHLAIDFVGEESKYLGRLWYPWETYGKYTYAEMVLIPDWLGGFGLSTLGVTRFLMKLRNTRLNQTTDFINAVLLPFMKVRRGTDITEQDIIRTGFARLLELDNPADVQFETTPQLPASAWQDQAQYQRDMQQADPTTIDFAPGNESTPGPAKFATTAKLAAEGSDSVTADTLDQIGMFVRDVVELELAMDQQAMNEEEEVPKSYFQRIDAESLKGAGGTQARVIRVSPMDLQEIYEILPEQGSTLAADDEFRTQGLQQFLVLGERHPDVVSIRAVMTALARVTPGIDPEQVILPPPPPTPPVPPVKLNISIAIKWDDLAPDVQAAILSHEGLPTELTHVQGVGKVIQHVSDAADAASNLEAPVDHTPQPPAPAKPNGKAGKATPKRV